MYTRLKELSPSLSLTATTLTSTLRGLSQPDRPATPAVVAIVVIRLALPDASSRHRAKRLLHSQPTLRARLKKMAPRTLSPTPPSLSSLFSSNLRNRTCSLIKHTFARHAGASIFLIQFLTFSKLVSSVTSYTNKTPCASIIRRRDRSKPLLPLRCPIFASSLSSGLSVSF